MGDAIGMRSRVLAASLPFFFACPDKKASDSSNLGIRGPVAAEAARAEAIRGLSPPMHRDARFRRGVSLGLFASTEEPEEQRAIYGRLLDEVRAIGASDVAILNEWSQARVSSSSVSRRLHGKDGDALLEWVIDRAHARGLRVFSMPIITLEIARGRDWRGTLQPSDWDAWWSSYEALILEHADLCSKKAVELLSVGSELVSAEAQDDRWRSLIKRVRGRYGGLLTYSANWDHFEPVPFFDALDLIGVSVYPPLARDSSQRDEAVFERGWVPFVQRLREKASETGRRYVFTEVGYPSHTEAALRPWDYRPKGAPDPALQATLYRVLFKTWQADPKLEGLFVWNWFGFGGLDDRSYTPRGKPSAAVLQHWYRRSVEPEQ